MMEPWSPEGRGMRSQRSVETGQCWLKHLFAHISNEVQDTVVITYWDVQDHDSAYYLRFQIAGQEEETLRFTRGTLRTCGKSDNEAVRRRVEAAIRYRLTRSDASAG